jgi:TolB protein
MIRRTLPGWLIAGAALVLTAPLAAQDTTRTPDGIRIGIDYNPASRPRVVVLPGAGIDSARAMVARDLDYSDRFEVIPLGPRDSGGVAVNPGGRALDYALFRTLGAGYAVELAPEAGGTTVRLHDITAGAMRREQRFSLPAQFDLNYRMAVHKLADEVVRWITGTPGYAASRILYLVDRRLYRVDSDGGSLTAISAANEEILSPTWSPDGKRFAYTRFSAGRGSLILQGIAGGDKTVVATTNTLLNITPAFSGDGRLLAFARSGEEGTDIYTADAVQNCCVQRLTVGRFSDNLSPTFAPDGRRLAFVSTRAGAPQIYVMAADGTDQELFAPFDYGVTGSSNAPEWSPDGASVAFHRDVNRAPQVFVLDVTSRRVRQLTSSGRNEDPSWAPDGRHLVFVSDRSGRRQLWVIDIVTGKIRQLTFEGQARLPAWSRRLTDPVPTQP